MQYGSRYMLTNDFKILYWPNTELKLSCKEFDFKTMKFEKYQGNVDLLEYYYEIDKNNLDSLIKGLFQSKIGFELPKKEMDWIINVENLMSKKKEILNNKKLMFNYCVLKLKLAGFKEDVALDFTKNQFSNEEVVKDYPNHLYLIKNVNKLINSRAFWINHEVLTNNEIELSFLRLIFDYKIRLGSKFDFTIFKSQYLDLIKDSFIPKLINYNSTKSYLVKKPMPLKNQVEYIFQSYQYLIVELINYLLNKEYDELLSQEYFIRTLINDLMDVLSLYIEIRLQEK
ncbi:MAG: hypothetical protein GX889_04930 [Clostridiales bacterium]|nr:hypothetical protein [Clostridiales bacterium]